jgi:hypothetical protein
MILFDAAARGTGLASRAECPGTIVRQNRMRPYSTCQMPPVALENVTQTTLLTVSVVTKIDGSGPIRKKNEKFELMLTNVEDNDHQ